MHKFQNTNIIKVLFLLFHARMAKTFITYVTEKAGAGSIMLVNGAMHTHIFQANQKVVQIRRHSHRKRPLTASFEERFHILKNTTHRI